jgi:hypothetical protein
LGMLEDPTIHKKVHAFWGELIQGASTVVRPTTSSTCPRKSRCQL